MSSGEVRIEAAFAIGFSPPLIARIKGRRVYSELRAHRLSCTPGILQKTFYAHAPKAEVVVILKITKSKILSSAATG